MSFLFSSSAPQSHHLSTFSVSFQGRYWPKVFFPEDEWSTWSHECSQGALLGRSLQKTIFNLPLNLVQSGAFWSPPKKKNTFWQDLWRYLHVFCAERTRASFPETGLTLFAENQRNRWEVISDTFRLSHPHSPVHYPVLFFPAGPYCREQKFQQLQSVQQTREEAAGEPLGDGERDIFNSCTSVRLFSFGRVHTQPVPSRGEGRVRTARLTKA